MRIAAAVHFADALVVDGTSAQREQITQALRRFGPGVLRFALRNGIRIIPLEASQPYGARSAVIRKLGVAIDDWPEPPAGLFVVSERTMYLRSTSLMTVAHEFGHAIDCAAGSGVYMSTTDPRIARAFAHARAFISPYAASGHDEYFAEAVRAYVDANDTGSPWPLATAARLAEIDPAIFAYVDDLLCSME